MHWSQLMGHLTIQQGVMGDVHAALSFAETGSAAVLSASFRRLHRKAGS